MTSFSRETRQRWQILSQSNIDFPNRLTLWKTEDRHSHSLIDRESSFIWTHWLSVKGDVLRMHAPWCMPHCFLRLSFLEDKVYFQLTLKRCFIVIWIPCCHVEPPAKSYVDRKKDKVPQFHSTVSLLPQLTKVCFLNAQIDLSKV